jgi:hypothetical protein
VEVNINAKKNAIYLIKLKIVAKNALFLMAILVSIFAVTHTNVRKNVIYMKNQEDAILNAL